MSTKKSNLHSKQKFTKDLPGSAFRDRKTTTGFTLVELLVVISIISFLSSIVLASMQTARDKAVTAKITEDLRQVKIAAELAYGDNDNYIFITTANPNENVLANNEASIPEDNDFTLIKKANAEELGSAPPACVLFNKVAGVFVEKKYLASVPKHPKENYSKGICYKAATSTDGSYFAAYAETPAEFDLNGSSVPKSVGFVVGDTGVAKLNLIRESSKVNGTVTYLRNSNNDDSDITSVADIADEVMGFTSGLAANYGSLLSSPTSGILILTCPSGQAINTLGVCQDLYTGIHKYCVEPATPDPFSNGCIEPPPPPSITGD